MKKELTLEFETMATDGMAVGKSEGKLVLAFGVLPQEKARVEIVRKRKGTYFAKPLEILVPSPSRMPPKEAHHLSCSPWQILDYRAQIAWKKQILEDLFSRVSSEPISADRFYESELEFGYRNKLEFSFTSDEGRVTLATFARGSPFKKLPLESGCLLGTAEMNAAALEAVAALNRMAIEPAQLKSLIVRQSRTTGEVISALFVKDEAFEADQFRLGQSAGLVVAWSDPKSPASLVTKRLATRGREELEEMILDLRIAYPYDGFFQNHVPLFEKALIEIREHVPRCEKIVEIYSGAGVIGLALRDRARKIYGIENSPSAIACARRNKQRNDACNYDTIEAVAEQLPRDLLGNVDVLIVDPPRSGMHPKLIGKIRAAKPKRIVYLSCNPANQCRDFALLKEDYRPVGLIGFDFYPQTPHIESLLILDSK